MRAWLFAWNPDKWHWEDYERNCEKTSKENPLYYDWSSQSKQTQAGDEFYLMKQGKKPRGIIAHGFLTGGTIDDDHWDEERAEKKAHYVDIKFDTLLNYKEHEMLDVAILDELCPAQQWHPQSSGIQIKDEVLPKLHELWAEVTMEYPENPEESSYEEVANNEVDSNEGEVSPIGAEAGSSEGEAGSSEGEAGSSEDTSIEGEISSTEGTKKSVYTTKYERDPKIRRAFLKGKKLKCEVCDFDFENVYGKLGKGFVEVHHKKPVSEGVRTTNLDNDLAMLCSNCHRMIHRGKDHMITVDELKKIICENNHNN